MAAAIALRDDFDGPALRRLARGTKDAAQARRLLALAEIRDGGPALMRRGSAGSGCRRSATRCSAAFACKRERGVLRFNARGPAGLIDGKAPGNASKLDDAQRQALAAIVERGPIPAIHEVVRWRLADLAQWIWEEFGISLSETTVGRELRALGYRKISARPRHYAQNGLAIDDFKRRTSSRTGGDPRRAPGRNRDGAVVAGRGACGAEELHHPPMGETRHAAAGPSRSAHRTGVHLRRDLSEEGQGRRSGHC